MHTVNISFAELEKRLDEFRTDVEKIELLTDEATKCKVAISEVQNEANCLETTEIKLILKTTHQETSFIEQINSNKQIRKTVIRKLKKLISKIICKDIRDYLEKVLVLLEHYKTKLEARSAWNSYANTENSTQLTNTGERIIWMLGKKKLLELFVCLYLNEIIPKYSEEEILSHFVNEKQILFGKGFCLPKRFSWLDSDSAFAVLIDELAKLGAIEDENKYKIFASHFLNKKGGSFKDLAQKRNYTENFTKTGDFVRKILEDAKI